MSCYCIVQENNSASKDKSVTFAQEENGKIEEEANTKLAEVETTYNVDEPSDNEDDMEDTMECEETKLESVFNKKVEEDQGPVENHETECNVVKEDEIKEDSHLAIIESTIEADFVESPIVENGIEN